LTDQTRRDEGGDARDEWDDYRDDYYRDEFPLVTPRRMRLRVPRLSARMRRALRSASAVAVGVFLALGVAVGAFFLMLSRGPIAFAWLAPTIGESLDDLYGGRYRFLLADAAIANTDHGPTLSVSGLSVKAGGRTVLAAPRAELSVDLRSLLFGRIRPRRLEALDLELVLSVLSDGAITISAGAGADAPIAIDAAPSGETQAPPGQPVGRAAVLHQAAAMLRGLFDLVTSPDSAIGAIDRIGVQHGRLVIDDRTVDRVIRYSDLTLSLDKGAAGMKFNLAATGGTRRWGAVATATGTPGAHRVFDAHLHDLTLDEIALVGGFRNLKFDTDAPMSFDLHFALGANDSVLEAKGRFDVGAGFFRLEDPDHEPVMIETLSGAVRWDTAGRQFVIAPLAFKAGGFDMALEGSAVAPRQGGEGGQGGAESGAWRFGVRLAKPTVVAPERANEKNVAIDKGVLDATFRQAEKRLVFDTFAFSGPDANISLAGAIDWAKGSRVSYHLTAQDSQIRALTRLWPTHVATSVRSWFIDHAPAGILRRGAYSADFDDAALTAMRYFQSPPDDSVAADFEIVNATVTDALAGLPPITGLSGHAHVTGRTATFAATSGAVETSPGRRLSLAQGRLSVADNMIPTMPATLDMRLVGSVEAVADLLATPGVAAHAGMPIDPATLKGMVDGRARVDFEMNGDPRVDRTQLTIEANATNLSIEKFVGKERLEGATLGFVADRAGLRVNGSGKLYGAPATLDIRKPPGEKSVAQAQLTFVFDDAARAKAGYAIAGVAGPISATIKTPLPIEDVDTQIELDLSRATLDNPAPGLMKPAGRPAKASFVLARRGDGVTLDRLLFEAGAAQAQGVVELSREGAFRSARLTQARLSPGDDMRLDAQRAGDTVKIVVRGANIDARPMLKSWMAGASADRAPAGAGRTAAASASSSQFDDVDLEVKSPIVTGFGKQILANVELHMERRGGRARTFSLTGNFGRERLAVAMAPNHDGVPQVEISTLDGGSFLSFVDLYQKMDSGALTASILLQPNRADGGLRIRDFYLKHEPTMRQLMAQAGAERLERGGWRFDPDSVRIGQLQAGFTWSGGRLSVREGVMSGPEIGLTFDGFIDFSRESVDLGGSYVPAYALNSLLSNIPVLNVFITGGQNEGIFALNYRLAGSLNAPAATVNPLSVITPGLLRKIMGVIDGSTRPPDMGR
jgi:hypothetical protein